MPERGRRSPAGEAGATGPEGAPLLSLREVSKSYERGARRIHVLADVSLDVAAGQVVGVFGKRGAGKTTLLELAAGLLPADSGCVHFEGEDLSEWSDARLAAHRRASVGWVHRSWPRSGLRVGRRIALTVMREHSAKEALHLTHRALERVGVEGCIDHRWGELSDGERTLVGIAHALVRSPRLLLVDDPTIALHADEREQVGQMLRSLAIDDGVAVLMTTPDMSSLVHAHIIGSISGGRLLMPADFLQSGHEGDSGEEKAGGDVIEFPTRRRAG